MVLGKNKRVGHPPYLTTYVDESRSPEGDRTFSLCGYCDYSEKWVPFALEWGRILDEPRALEYFRAAEAANLEGQFKGFTRDERDDKVKKLLGLICSYRPIAIVSGLRGKDYDDLLSKYPEASVPPDPYHFCMGNILSESCDIAQEVGASQVEFVFDQNKETEAETHLAFEYAKKQVFRFKTYFGDTITFASKKKQRPLQAADSLAYDFNKMFRLRIADSKAKLRRSLSVIAENCPMRGLEWTKEMLEQFFIKRTTTHAEM